MLQEFLVTIGTLSFFIFLLIKYFGGNQNYWKKYGVPLIPSEKSIGMRFLTSMDILELDNENYKNLKGKPFGGVVELRVPRLVVTDPELIKAIMVKDFESFVDRRSFDADPVFGKMLFSMQGSEWKKMRNTLSPTFSTGRIRQMYEIFQENSSEFIQYLRHQIKSNPEIDVSHLFGRFTMSVINNAAFGVKSDAIQNPDSIFMKMGAKIQNFPLYKIFLLQFAPAIFKLLGLNIMETESYSFFAELVRKACKMREESGQKRNDFIQLMLEAKWGKGQKVSEKDEMSDFEKEAKLKTQDVTQLTNEDIVLQAVLFLFAGFDSVQSFIASSVAQIAVHPDMQERLYQECLKARDESGRISYDSIQSSKLEYMDAFINEVQRKYPAAFRTERKVTANSYTIPGTDATLPKGTVITFPTYGIQNDERYFPNPDKFDPERFLPENKGSIHPYSFLPFGHGPRNCIGMRFGLIEVKSVLCDLLLNFKIDPTAKTDIPIVYSSKSGGSYRPSSCLVFKFTPRN